MAKFNPAQAAKYGAKSLFDWNYRCKWTAPPGFYYLEGRPDKGIKYVCRAKDVPRAFRARYAAAWMIAHEDGSYHDDWPSQEGVTGGGSWDDHRTRETWVAIPAEYAEELIIPQNPEWGEYAP